MHDLNYLETTSSLAEMAKKRATVIDLDVFRKLDKERRELIPQRTLKAQRNKASEEIARSKRKRRTLTQSSPR